MKISDLQLKLTEIRDKHGDLEIFIHDLDDDVGYYGLGEAEVQDQSGTLTGVSWPDVKILLLS